MFLIAVLLLILLTALVSYKAPRVSPMVIAIPESPATGFDYRADDYGINSFLSKYPYVYYTVLMFNPDFLNEYRHFNATATVNQYFRMNRLDPWRQGDVKKTVELLHQRKSKVLLGTFMLGAYNYTGLCEASIANWVIHRHPELVLRDTAGKPIGCWDIIPYYKLHADPLYNITEGMLYYEYLGRSASRVTEDFGFDGFLLFELGRRDEGYTDADITGLTETFRYLSNLFHDNKRVFIVADFFSQPVIDIYKRIMPYVDYFMIQTYPYAKGVFYGEEEATLEFYLNYSKALFNALPSDQQRKLLFALETMDGQEGWTTPPDYLQVEARALIDSRIFEGFVINCANKVYPYLDTIESAFLHMSA